MTKPAGLENCYHIVLSVVMKNDPQITALLAGGA